MPYIITTRIDVHGDELSVDAYRTAVATLEEARDYATKVLRSAQSPLGIASIKLSESGGTVGPLPDGTVIEVRRVESFALGIEAGIIAADHPSMWSDVDICAKFNRTGRFADDPWADVTDRRG